ncbi:MAG TPA: hypothetical protein VGF92_14890 [Stellaceae bacterium]|jgi:hypothetical protein
MPRGAELWQALYGAWRFALLDRQALRYFDLSHRGTWRSFWAAAYCYPFFLLERWLELPAGDVASAGLGHIFFVESIGYLIGWTAFPLAALALCRALGREERGFDFITGYNWSILLQIALFVLIGLLSLVLPDSAGVALQRLGLIAALIYEWFIALVAIGAGPWIAGVIVIVDIVIGLFIQITALSLY